MYPNPWDQIDCTETHSTSYFNQCLTPLYNAISPISINFKGNFRKGITDRSPLTHSMSIR